MTSTDFLFEVVGRRYILHSKLGAGGMGAVYRATDRLTGDTVALKRVMTQTNAGDSAPLRLALSREFQTLASLRHPNVIGVIDYGFDDTRQPYYTMALVDQAQSLRDAGANQPLTGKINLIIQVLQALVYLHRRGIIHRDLKPDNALVNAAGQVKVLDFGLAVLRERAKEEESGGTLRYMAPEVLQGETPDELADLYAVGVMAYELISGNHPYEGSNVHQMMANILNTEPDMTQIAVLTLDPTSPATEDPQATKPQVTNEDDEDRTVRGPELPIKSRDQKTTRLSPHDDEMTTHLMKPVDMPRQAGYFKPVSLGAAENPLVLSISKLMAKQPQHRYQDARHAIADLRAAIGEPPEESSDYRESFLQAARFVGRDSELSRLEDALQQMLHGHGSIWLVGGESGVGKSRLLDEARTLAMVQGVLVLRGQAVSDGGVPYQLWRDPLQRLLLSVDPTPAEASVLKQILPEIDRLLDHPVPDAPALDGGDAQQRLHATISGLFARYCQNYADGVMVILEDLQWAGDGIEVINALRPLVKSLPILIIGNYRNDEAPDLPRLVPGGNVLDLKRLTRQSIVQLSESMLGEAGRQTQIVELLHRETEGNVFFLIEITRALAEEAGHLDRIGTMTLPQNVIAGGIQTIIQRRIDQVPPAYRPLLQIAAVTGRQLDLNVMRRVTNGVNLEDWLTACVNAAVMDWLDGHWQFTHDKVRERLIADLADGQRAALHEQIATAMEHAYADSLDQHAAALAFHWSFTGNSAKEIHYSRIAGEQSVDISAYSEAQRFYGRALALIVETNMASIEEVDVLIRLGDTMQALGLYEEASGHLTSALTLAQALGDYQQIAAALLGLGWVHMRQGNMGVTKTFSTESLAAARLADKVDSIIEALYLTGLTHLIEGQYEDANSALNECLPLARAHDDQMPLANILNALGAVAEGLGQTDEANAYLVEALDIGRALGNRYLMANVQGNLGRLTYNQKAYNLSKPYFQQALALFREIGSVYGEAMVLYYLGFIDTALDNDQPAMTALHESIRLSTNIGAITITLIALCGVARLTTRAGNKAGAVELLSMVMHHEASAADVDVEREATPLLDELARELTPAAFKAAQVRGREKDLEAVVTAMVDLKRTTSAYPAV